jgi:alkylation response protein AidB-like acyl-CoA dehydrogenase
MLLPDLLSPRQAPSTDSLTAWWDETREARGRETTTVDRALVGGVLADRLGFAFAAGYHEALRALVQGKSDDICALCITETRGNAPKDIDTTLTIAGDAFEITGKKKWATTAPLAKTLLVCATLGTGGDGKPMLRIVRVPADAPGVTLTASSAPFVPEIPHAEVELDHVRVTAGDILPGDGYTEYVKPFRTIEDAHVHAALIGYLIGTARRHGLARDLVEQLLATAVSARAIALADPRSPTTHLALAGLITLAGEHVARAERALEATDDAEWKRWLRDRALLRVAGAARAARCQRAWEAVG